MNQSISKETSTEISTEILEPKTSDLTIGGYKVRLNFAPSNAREIIEDVQQMLVNTCFRGAVKSPEIC